MFATMRHGSGHTTSSTTLALVVDKNGAHVFEVPFADPFFVRSPGVTGFVKIYINRVYGGGLATGAHFFCLLLGLLIEMYLY